MNSHYAIVQGITMMRRKSHFEENKTEILVLMIQSLKVNKKYLLLPIDQ